MTSRVKLRPNQLLLAAVGLLSASGPLAVSQAMVGLVKAQSEAPLAFEVASVRQRVMPGAGMIRRPWSSTIQCPPPLRCGISGTKFNEEAASLTDLVMDAYGVKRFQISGLPSWGDTGRDVYDIAAKVEGDRTPTLDQVRRMLQTLLADRFQLRLHHETKELPVYALVPAKNGPKLKPTTGPCSPPGAAGGGGDRDGNKGGGTGTPGGDEAAAFLFSWERLPEMLSGLAGRPVIDKTGFEGRYCTLDGQEPLVAVMGAPQMGPGAGRGREPRSASPDADSGGASIFTAVEEKLGLKLEPQKGPVDILVIDSVARPSEN
jgi:uncharacterized protein (TIGR03435 family)